MRQGATVLRGQHGQECQECQQFGIGVAGTLEADPIWAPSARLHVGLDNCLTTDPSDPEISRRARHSGGDWLLASRDSGGARNADRSIVFPSNRGATA